MVRLESPHLVLTFDPAALSGQIVQKSSGVAWAFDLAAARGVVCGQAEPMWAEFPWTQHSRAMDRLRPLRPADLRAWRERGDGVELDFHVAGADFRVVLHLTDEPGEFVFRLQPLATGRADLIAAELPGPLSPVDGGCQVMVTYRHQGRLFTGRPGPLETETPQARELVMPEGRHRLRFFGVLGGTEQIGTAPAGYVAVIEENADARIVLRQAGDGRLACSVGWMPSLGTLACERVIRYRFEDRPTVTTLAKAFRRYVRSAGLFKSLKDKIAERPAVGALVGATACFIGYEASELDYVETFRRLRAMGHQRFYAFPLYHINCGFEGHFAGFKTLDIRRQAQALRELGALTGSWIWLAGIPDKPELLRLAARNADATMPLNWRIGTEIYPQMCMRQAAQYLAGCGADLLDADVHHFDTTASNSLMECYAPSHPLDRRGDRAFRTELFRQAAALGRVVASEGVKDWAVPHCDVGSNKEVPVRHESAAFRVLPIQHLVYHDALFMLWWEADAYDIPYWLGGDVAGQSLTDLLYGDMPLIMPVGRQYRWVSANKEDGAVEFDHTLEMPACRTAAERAVAVARHFARVATEEMTDFAWLGGDGAVQQTQFANGVSVIANFGASPFEAANRAIVPPGAAITL